MKKLLARIKQWNKSNAGLTLVEIIVTMLILVIIALPILGGFIVATRANAMAKDLAYARDAAENVIEVLDGLGVSEEALETGDGWACDTLTEEQLEANSFTYTVTGVRAGTGVYTAKVTCNKATYTDANNYELPDMSVLDAEETVVIFPESNFYKFDDAGVLDTSSDLHRFDTTAINDFYREYHDGVIDIYNTVVYASYLNEVKRIEEANELIEEENRELGTTNPTLTPPLSPPYPEDIREADVVKNGLEPVKTFIHRTVDVKLSYSPNTEYEDDVQATVSTEYVYRMKDRTVTGTIVDMVNASFKEYRYDTDFDGDGIVDFEDSDGDGSADYYYISMTDLDAAINALVEQLKEQKAYAVVAPTTADSIDSIYMVTYPFNAVDGQISNYNTLALTAELQAGVANNYLNDKSVNVFLAVQEDAAYNPNPEAGDSFNITLTNGSVFKLYSQMGLTPTEGSLPSPANDKLYNNKENSSGNVLLDVTVKIYDPSNVVDGQELTEVTTTIISK